MTAFRLLTIGSLVFGATMSAQAQQPTPEANPSESVLRGRVVDVTGTPLSYANVQINYSGRRYLADDSGRFQLPYEGTGSRTVVVRRIGFEPAEIRLSARPDTALRVVLVPIPTQLKEVTVEAASAYRSLDIHGFYGRMKDGERGINHGWFFTPEDIARRNPSWITQMADGLPTVRVSRGRTPTYDRILGSRNCSMTVYLDNIRLTGKLGGRDDLVNELVAVTHVAALEIYPRAVGAPPQYQPLNGTCGVVLIWTK
jgi:hypothetical protein